MSDSDLNNKDLMTIVTALAFSFIRADPDSEERLAILRCVVKMHLSSIFDEILKTYAAEHAANNVPPRKEQH